jgi:hypothetical protein
MMERIRSTFQTLPDVRRGGNNQRYAMEDAVLSAFSVFFTQSPSFLDYQVRMQRQLGKNNAQSLFGVHPIPSDNQIRNLLDPVPPQSVFPLFAEFSEGLYRHAYLQPFRSVGDTLLVALDGTEYFCSQKIHCIHCSYRTLRNGETLYYHVALTPVIVAPGQEAVVPLAPEFVRPQDGHDKQDCELAAAGRWLRQMEWALCPLGHHLTGR